MRASETFVGWGTSATNSTWVPIIGHVSIGIVVKKTAYFYEWAVLVRPVAPVAGFTVVEGL